MSVTDHEATGDGLPPDLVRWLEAHVAPRWHTVDAAPGDGALGRLLARLAPGGWVWEFAGPDALREGPPTIGVVRLTTRLGDGRLAAPPEDWSGRPAAGNPTASGTPTVDSEVARLAIPGPGLLRLPVGDEGTALLAGARGTLAARAPVVLLTHDAGTPFGTAGLAALVDQLADLGYAPAFLADGVRVLRRADGPASAEPGPEPGEEADRPALTVVVASRNDGYGERMEERVSAHARSVDLLAEVLGQPVEHLVVEWNPPLDRPPLATALPAPRNPLVTQRVVTAAGPRVEEQVRRRGRPFAEYPAKNVGVRRARAPQVLVTNQDVVFTREFAEAVRVWLGSDFVGRAFARCDRFDIEVPAGEPFPDPLDLAAAMRWPLDLHVHGEVRSCRGLGPEQIAGLASQPAPAVGGTVRFLSSPPAATALGFGAQALHDKASGDMVLASRAHFWAAGGHCESLPWRAHLDNLLLARLRGLGLQQVVFGWPAVVVHVDHGRGGQVAEPWHEALRVVPGLLRGNPYPDHPVDWGFGSEAFAETVRVGSPPAATSQAVVPAPPRQATGKRVIAFSLYGTSPTYLVGAIKNAILARTVYPGWRCRFWVGDSVPAWVTQTLALMDHVDLVPMPGAPEDLRARLWRFLAASDPEVEVCLCRDADSRLNVRERAAVDEWLASGRQFHTMHDHRCHAAEVMGGMWGCRGGALPDVRRLVAEFGALGDRKAEDQRFLRDRVIPLMRGNVLAHDSREGADLRGNGARPFPVDDPTGRYVGQGFDQSEVDRFPQAMPPGSFPGAAGGVEVRWGTARTAGKKRVIAFSLFGEDPTYHVGAIKNALLALRHYPGWFCRFYVGRSVPVWALQTLSLLDHVELVDMAAEPEDLRARLWRFLAASDPEVEVCLCRDADSRLNVRERAAVEEWLASGRQFHVMRDNGEHNVEILGGAWGCLGGALPDMRRLIAETGPHPAEHGTDQAFLKAHVYPVAVGSLLAHDERFAFEPPDFDGRRRFPLPDPAGGYVSMAFDESDRDRYPAATLRFRQEAAAAARQQAPAVVRASPPGSEIPVFIPTFNNPTHVAGMLRQLRERGVRDITLVDGASAFPPMVALLEREAANGVTVIRLPANRGPWAITQPPHWQGLPQHFCLTDPDLELNPAMPEDFLAQLADLTRRLKVPKAGLALDISDWHLMRQEKLVRNGVEYHIWEHQERFFWSRQIGLLDGQDPVYDAAVDTTFAVYNKAFFDPRHFERGVRVAGRYTCRHLPWYRNTRIDPAEATFYATAQRFSNWSMLPENDDGSIRGAAT